MPLLRTHIQVRPVDTFSRMMAQTTRTRARMCLFGIGSHGSPFRGQKPQEPTYFGAWIGAFKPNSQNRKTCILSKLSHRFRTHFAQWYEPLNAIRGWSRHTHHKSKMADGRHLGKIEKSPYLSCNSSNFDEIWHDDAVRPSWPFKIWNFEKCKLAAAAILNK